MSKDAEREWQNRSTVITDSLKTIREWGSNINFAIKFGKKLYCNILRVAVGSTALTAFVSFFVKKQFKQLNDQTWAALKTKVLQEFRSSMDLFNSLQETFPIFGTLVLPKQTTA